MLSFLKFNVCTRRTFIHSYKHRRSTLVCLTVFQALGCREDQDRQGHSSQEADESRGGGRKETIYLKETVKYEPVLWED